MTRKILIADDERGLLDALGGYLRQAGYQVVTARNGREAVFAFRHEQPDLVVLDVMMPEMDGWEAARWIRRESAVPLLFLTARVDDADQIAGLEIGADEYLTKPFSPPVVVARVRALLRRAYDELHQEAQVWRAGPLELNAAAHTVRLAGRTIELTPSEFALLQALIQRPGRVFTREELLEALPGDTYAIFERTVDVHIKNLRLKLEEDPKTPRFIETVYGVGYRLRPDDA
jgi:two-component system OmpR family response regulator